MRTIQQDIGAGQTVSFGTGGTTYFRLVESTDAVDIILYRSGMPTYEAAGMEAGFWARPDGGFDRVDIRSATAQTVKVAMSRGDAGYDRLRVDIASSLSVGDEITDAAPVTVGVARVALVAADPTRRALRFAAASTNTAVVYAGGAGVTTANGCINLAAGDVWLEDNAAAAAWYAISGAAAQEIRVQEIF